MLKSSLKRFGEIVSVSSAAAAFAKSAYHIDSAVVPNAVDTKRFRTSHPAKNTLKRIVFLGRLVERKGAGQLLEAFGLLIDKVPDAELVIAGDGPNRPRLEAQAEKLGITKAVKFLGYIGEEDKPKLLASADVACFPSLYGESFGIVLIEAMAAGSRVILAGDNPGYRSVLGSQPELLVDPHQTEIFAKRLNELLTDKKKIDGLHKWQRANVAQYDIAVVGAKLLDIYNGQIARQAKKSNNETYG